METKMLKAFAAVALLVATIALAGPALARPQPITFAPPVPYAAGSIATSEPTMVTSADFDSDGDADLAVANTVDASFSVFLNDGDGTFASAVTTPITRPSPTGPTPRPMGIASDDLNRDGRADVAVTSPPNGGVFVFFGDGDGTFDGSVPGPQNPTFLQAGTRTFGAFIGRLDADSRPDIAVTNLGPRGTATDLERDTVSAFRNNPDQTGPDGVFGPATSLPAGDSPSSTGTASTTSP